MKTMTFKRAFIAIAMMLVTAATSWAYDFYVGGIYYNKNSDGKTVYVTYYSGIDYSGSVVIPSTVTYSGTTYSVTSIDSGAFRDCSGLTSVTIPNSVTKIGSSAFYNCSGLTSVTIPNSVTSIGSYAFWNCSGLTSVTIPNSVTSIGEKAFYNCSGLTSVQFNAENCTTMGSSDYSAFAGCYKLTSLTIGEGVKTIPDYAFKNCSSLKQLTIQDGTSTLSLGYNARSYTAGVNGKGLFYDAPLESVYLGRNLSYDSSYSCGFSPFYGKSAIKELTIGNMVTSIGWNAFSGCSGLTSVTIPNSVTEIGGSAFGGCSGLNKVEISDIAAWCKISFGSLLSNPLYYAHHLYLNGKEVTDLVIPNSVTSIGENAFYSCSGLTSVTIGNSVTEIGGSAFYNCSGLTSVVFNAENCTTMGASGSPVFYGCSNLTSLTIGENVKTIPDYAFQSCSGLTSVTIPNSVTSIGESAFSGCSSLSILKWNVIAHPDFSSSLFPNSPITSVVIGDEVVSVPNYLCKDITTINQVSIGKQVETIGNNSFAGCTGIKTITWKPINYTGKLPFPSTITPTQFSFGNAVETIPENLCYGYSKITSITLPATVKTIGDMAFFGCNLTKVTCRAALPPTMLETTFSQSAYDNATLYVYANSEDYYRDDEFWQNFYNVQTLSGGTVIEPVQLSVLFPDRGKVAIAVPYNKSVTLTVFPNDVAGFGLSSATFNGVEIFDELDENYQYTTPVLTENAVLSVVYVSVASGVDQSLANRIKVSASNGTVRVHGAAPESEVLVCDLSGKIVRKSTEKTFTLGEGIYVLNVEGLSFKFAM